MSTITKKISSVVLSATTALWLTGAGALMPVAHGATTAELQAQINALLAQIQLLQAQLASSSGAPAVASCSFTRDLTVGVRGDDVKCLQGSLKVDPQSGYFGPLTKAAVAKWQADNGVSPAVGYFGSKSRAKYASLAVGGVAPAPAPGAPAAPVPVGSGLTVTLASDQPVAGLFGESFASRPFTKLILSASADGDVTVNSLTVERVGQGQDAAFSGVIALDEDGVRLSDAKTFGSDHKTRLTEKFVVKAGLSRTITLAGDSDSDQNDYNGQLVGLALAAVDAGTSKVNASLPLVGNHMTVNSTLAIGALTLERGAVDPGTSITKEVGTQGYIFSALKMTAGSNEDVTVKSIRWNQSGSAAKADLANIKVYLDGVAYDAEISADAKYYIAKFGANGVKIEKGFNKEAYVKGDVLSGSNRTVDFDLYRYADVKVTGLTYNYDILPTSAEGGTTTVADDGEFTSSQPNYDAFQVTIGTGSLSVEKATSVGAQNIAENLGDQILGGFVADVKGEDVSVAAMNFDASIVEAAGTGGAIDTNDITGIKLVDETGNVVAGPVDGVAGGNNAIRFTDTVTFKAGRKTYKLLGKLGTDVSQNDTVAASTTPSSDWSTVKGVSTGVTITPSGSTVTMSTMTIKTGALTFTIANDTASTSPDVNVVLGTGAFTFAKYVLDASESGEDLRATSMQLDLITSYPANTADELTNCQLFDGSTPLNTGTNVVNPTNDDAAGADKTFNFDTGLVIPKGTVKTLALKCNLTAGGTTEFVGWGSAGLTTAANQIVVTGVTSGTTIAETTTGNNGRTVVAQSAGTIAVALDASSPSLKMVQAGSVDNSLNVLRFTASYEDVRIDLLGLQIATSTGAGGVQHGNASNTPSDTTKVTLWDGATKVGEVVFTGDFATATLSNFVVPKDATKLLTVKADVAPVNVNLSQAIPGHLINVDWDAGWGDAADDDAREGAQGLKAVGVSSGTTVYPGTAGTGSADTASNGARIVKAIPTVEKVALASTKFVNSSDQILYRFKVAAPAGTNGVSLFKFTFRVSTSTNSVPTAESEKTGAGGFALTNFRVKCYSDSAFSQGSCGSSTGLLNQYDLAVADGTADNVDFEDADTLEDDADEEFYVLFNPTATGATTGGKPTDGTAIRIDAGTTRYFELLGDSTGASSTPIISVKLLGDSAWQATQCNADTAALTVDVCDAIDSTADRVDSGGDTPASAFAGTASSTAWVGSGLDEASTTTEVNNNFIWSNNATNTSMDRAAYDWFNGFLIPGLPSGGLGAETLTF